MATNWDEPGTCQVDEWPKCLKWAKRTCRSTWALACRMHLGCTWLAASHSSHAGLPASAPSQLFTWQVPGSSQWFWVGGLCITLCFAKVLGRRPCVTQCFARVLDRRLFSPSLFSLSVYLSILPLSLFLVSLYLLFLSLFLFSLSLFISFLFLSLSLS